MESTRKRILVCNDDGIDAPGIVALVHALFKEERFDIRVVAPSVCQSAKSHSISLKGVLVATQHMYPSLSDIIAFKVDGTPADCVKVALNTSICGNWIPDLVVSGINRGLNTGLNIHYSGTIAAAREANICGIPGIAFSMEYCGATVFHYEDCASMALEFIDEVLLHSAERKEEFSKVVFNINFPNVSKEENLGWKFVRQGNGILKDDLVELSSEKIESGVEKKVFTIRAEYLINSNDLNVDSYAVSQRHTAVTTLPLLTDHLPPNEEIMNWKVFSSE